MGAVHSVAVILALIAWFASLVALVVLPIQLLRSRRVEPPLEQPYYAPRPRVRTIDRFRAAARRLSWGPRTPRTANRMPGISREQTAYRPGPPYPMAQRGQRPPDDMPRRAWRPDASNQRQPLWPPDTDHRFPTLQSATVVRPRPDGRTPPSRGERDQPPPPRSRRDR